MAIDRILRTSSGSGRLARSRHSGSLRFNSVKNSHPMATKFSAKIYFSGVTTADAVASFVVPRSARLVAVQYEGRLTVNAAVTEYARLEVSQASASQFLQAEGQGVICSITQTAPSATAGLMQPLNIVLAGFDIPCEAGSKIYFHRYCAAAPGALFTAFNLFFV